MKAELLAAFGDDLMVVNTARVSMGKRHNVFDPKSDLDREGHWSLFSPPKATFHLHLPFFVA